MKQCEIRESDLWVEVLVALFMVAAIGGAGIFYIRHKAPGPDEMNKPEFSSTSATVMGRPEAFRITPPYSYWKDDKTLICDERCQAAWVKL